MKSIIIILVSLILVSIAFCFQKTTIKESSKDCSEDQLKNCTRDLLKFSSDDVEVPSTESEVADSCS